MGSLSFQETVSLVDVSFASCEGKGLLLDFVLPIPSAIQFEDDSHSL